MAEMISIKEADFTFEDARGGLVQLVHQGYEQINVLTTKRNVTRGGHYHKRSSEAFYVVSGAVEVTAGRDGTEKRYRFEKGGFFEIPPYVTHSMFFPEDCVMVQMYDKRVELPDGTKDIYAEGQS